MDILTFCTSSLNSIENVILSFFFKGVFKSIGTSDLTRENDVTVGEILSITLTFLATAKVSLSSNVIL